MKLRMTVVCGALAICLVSAAASLSQEARAMGPGQTVEIFCSCFGPNAWTAGKIESIDEGGYV